jgi:hypothetical protein
MGEKQTFDQLFTNMMLDHTGVTQTVKRNIVWPPAGEYEIQFGALDEDPDSPTFGLNSEHGFIKVPYTIDAADKNIGPGPYEMLFWFKTVDGASYTNDLLNRLNGQGFIPYGTTTPASVSIERARDLNGRTAIMVRETFVKDNKELANDRFFLSKAEKDEATAPKKIGGDPEPSIEDVQKAAAGD